MLYPPLWTLILFATTGFPGSPGSIQDEPPPGEVKLIAEEAFVYGFPMVMNYGTMYEYAIDKSSSQYKAPFNQISNTARVFTPRDTAIVTPNSDTPYSFLWMDLRAEPLVLTIPPIDQGRYFSVQLIDLYTHNYDYLGTRTTGNAGGAYLVAGPSWKGDTPRGIDRVIRCETEFSLAGYRTQLFGPDDLERVKAIQSGYKVQPLSSFLGTPSPPKPASVEWPRIDKALAASHPFTYLSLMLSFCPAEGTAAVEKPLRQRFARIGIEAGKPFDPGRLSPSQRAALEAGMRSGLEAIRKRLSVAGKEHNGWRIASLFGDRQFYKEDWTLRAAAAMGGIYGNDASEAVYPMLAHDDQGNPPDCSRKRYTLTFPKGQFPPANAFWSVTAYNAKTQLLIDNPINRYLINSPMLKQLKTNQDGSLTIYIQKDSPGEDRSANWLPAPDGPVYLVMRIYWPKAAALDGTWKPPVAIAAE
ncbi:MAG: DUF1254 domain-containing protein [Isosphaeraceae bacterium]